MQPTLHDLFDVQAAREPDRPAVVSEGRAVSYGTTAVQVRRLSEMLVTSGVGPGDLVEVSRAPGVQGVVDLLALWRLGAVPDFRPPRSASVGVEPPPSGGGIRVTAAAPAGDIRGGAGVVVGTRALAGQVRWATRRWGIRPDDRVLCAARTPAQFCFDAFLALAAGACVVSADPDDDPDAVAALLVAERVTVAPLGADLAARLVPGTRWTHGGAVRLVVCHDAPEPLPGPDGPPDGPGAVQVWSTYGLSAVGSVLAAGRRRPAAAGEPAGVLAGRPVDQVRLSVLDPSGEPAPAGAAGELHVGGAAAPLTLGTDARTTADHLVPDPFGPPGTRMLRTGRAARWTATGDLQLVDATGDPDAALAAYAPPDRPLTAAESAVADVWAQVLGVRPTGPHDDFYALGGYSLLVLQLADRLRRVGGTPIPIGDLFRAATVAEQAALLPDQGRVTAPGEDVVDARLAPDVRIGADLGSVVDVRTAATGRPRRVLLTGGSGFLGAFLLARLLEVEEDLRVVCLVRAGSPAEAARRLERNLRAYLLPTAALDRVEALPGDLELPRFGLGPAAFAELGTRLDLVVHNGARVNLADPYARVRGANVHGTHEVIRLAAPRALPVHLVSTASVPPGEGAVPPAGAGGYVRSKWVAEQLVRRAHEAGLPTAIYRPSRVTGDTATGAGHGEDAFWTVVKACLELGLVPQGEPWDGLQADLVPADYVAAAVVHLALNVPADGSVYTLANPTPVPVRDVLDRARAAGYPLSDVSGPQWQARLAAAAAGAFAGSAVPAAAVLAVMADPEQLSSRQPLDLAGAQRALAGAGITCPPVGPDLLDGYLRFFASSGQWPAPAPGHEPPLHGEVAVPLDGSPR